jgi:hypothetical protein
MKNVTLTTSLILAQALCLTAQDSDAAPQPVARLAPAAGDVVTQVHQDAARRLSIAVRLTGDVQDADVVAILVSDTDHALRFPGAIGDVLAGNLLHVFARPTAIAGLWLDPSSDVFRRPFDGWLQAVAVRPGGSIRPGQIMPLEWEEGGYARKRPDADVQDTDRDGDLSGYTGPKMIARQLDGKGIWVEFETPSNDYALRFEESRQSGDGTDVFLTLEEPGPGEGQLDVVEFHSMAIGVSRQNGNHVRVFVNREQRHTGTGDVPKYELAAELMMR